MKTYFITGIGTDVGKTIVSAIITEALQADYWKPIQCGSLDHTDTDVVKSLVTNEKSFFYPEAYRLQMPASPNIAAGAEKINIELKNFSLPETENHLVIEGAGGLLVPVNDTGFVMAGLISRFQADVILVVKNYLGCINHTLLTVEALQQRHALIHGIIFNGDEDKHVEETILNYTGLLCLGRVGQEQKINREVVMKYSQSFKNSLL